jgi:hypothetical protein
MKRILLVLLTVALVGAAVGWSGSKVVRPEFDFKTEKENPITHLRLNDSPNDFRFAIVSDRTGGHRAKVFSKAVDQLNLLQPEFVVSVGDLIEGYKSDKQQLAREWREFQTYLARLRMPFFFVAGNHDLANKTQAAMWQEKFGRTHYRFVYRDVLFVMLDSEDPPDNRYGAISEQQLGWLEKILAAHPKPRWTMVFLHKPMWVMPDLAKNGWLKVEKLLAGRPYTVFAGHVHRYQKFTRQGQNLYMLATTGGASRMRGVEYGEFDHIVQVTMKKDGPVIANILLDGVLREDLSPILSDEQGDKEYYRRPTYPVAMKVTLDGKPIPGSLVALRGKAKEPRPPYADGLVEAEGSVRLSTYTAFDGVPAGEYACTVELRKPYFTPDGKRGPNLLPARYASTETTPLTVKIKPGKNELTLELTK